MRLPIEMVGKRFGRLLVLKRAKVNSPDNKPMYLCRCDCGHKTIVRGKQLRSGKTKSCGCLSVDASRAAHLRHEMAYTPTYGAWQRMRARCLNPNVEFYKHYGGRGIKICARWSRFENFYSDMGEKPHGMSLDRINTNGHYEPSNCRWATPLEQANNKRSSVFLTHNGETLTLSQWARKIGISQSVLSIKLSKGLPVEKILAPKTAPRKFLYRGEMLTLPRISALSGIPYVTLAWRARNGRKLT